MHVKVREKRTRLLENRSGTLAMPLVPPVTATRPRTAPFAQRACGLTASEIARAEPPSAKNRAAAAITVAGLGWRRIVDLLQARVDLIVEAGPVGTIGR